MKSRAKASLGLVLLAACGTVPLPTPDAGPVRVDAGVTRDAGAALDAGGTVDAGPPEPTFSSAVLFRDDFERYADGQGLRAAYPELLEVGGAIALERDGGQALRLDYTGQAGCAAADVHVGKVVQGDVPTVLVTWRSLMPGSFANCGDAGVVDFVLTRGGTQTRFERAGGRWLLRVGSVEFAQHLALGTHAPTVLARDAWHRVTLLLTRESGVGQDDGVVQAWVDGALVIDRVGATGPAAFSLATWPGEVFGQAAQARWVDDLAISTP